MTKATTADGLRSGAATSSSAARVFRLQFPQQRPGKNESQSNTHENSKDDENDRHPRLLRIPKIPNDRTVTPMMVATNPTFLLSKSCDISIVSL